MSEKRVDISVLIVSWNTRDLLCDCIDSLYKYLGDKISYEIIVVDNASSDDSAIRVSSQFPAVKLIENEENVGFGNAVNQAASMAAGRYFFLLNSDARLLDDSLLEFLADIEADKSIGVTAGRMVVDESGRTKYRQQAFFSFPSLFNLITIHSLDLIRKTRIGPQGKSRNCKINGEGVREYEVDWIAGAHLLLRRELLDEGELMDSRIFMYFEDALLCKKAWDKGYRVVFFDKGKILHVGGASAKKVTTGTSVFGYQGSRIYVEEMYGRTVLWIYERMMRSIWYAIIPMLGLAGLLGFKQTAKDKLDIFRGLLAVPLLT